MEIAFQIADPMTMREDGSGFVTGRALLRIQLGDILYASSASGDSQESAYVVKGIEGYGRTFTYVRPPRVCGLILHGEHIENLSNATHLCAETSSDENMK